MRKIVKRLLMAGVISCGVGVILYGAGSLLGGKEYVRAADLNRMSGTAMRDSEDNANKMPKTQIDDVSKIDVDFENIDFHIKTSDDEHYYLEYTLEGDEVGVGQKNPFTYEAVGDTLQLREQGGVASSRYVKIDIGALSDIITGQETREYENEVTLYVPKDQMINGAIKMGDGDLEVADVKTEALKIASNYGDISLDGLTMKDSTVKSDDGDIEMTGMSFEGKNVVNTAYGDVDVILKDETKDSLSISCETKYGEIETSKDLKGNQNVSDDASFYERKVDQATGNLKINADDGDISVQ